MFPKPERKDDGAFNHKNPPQKQCIKCGIWYPGNIERHHGKSKGAGGDHTWLNRFDLCVGPPHDCHGKAQRGEKGYRLKDLEEAKSEAQRWNEFYNQLIGEDRHGS